MTFAEIVSLVIDKLEGGYFHPNMLLDGRVKDARYSKSGETMFGIDRKQGGSINTSESGIKFWGLIDNANAASNWKWNYKGGPLAPELKRLAADMLKPPFNTLSKLYLKTPQALQIVKDSAALTFHFVYATYNGSGWFKKFASDIMAAINTGITDPAALSKIAISSRTNEGLKKGSPPNSLIAQSGNKIAKLFDTISTPAKIIVPILVVGILLFLLLKK